MHNLFQADGPRSQTKGFARIVFGFSLAGWLVASCAWTALYLQMPPFVPLCQKGKGVHFPVFKEGQGSVCSSPFLHESS